MLVVFPKTCTIKIAFVFFEIFDSKSFKFKFNVDLSISINFGFNPLCIIGHNDVDQHKEGIKTSSPLLISFSVRVYNAL